MTGAVAAKWNRASRTYDLVTWGDERRLGPAKEQLFARMAGRCLMVAAGTGNDFRHFPAGLTITAIDISPAMIARARPKAMLYQGRFDLAVMDVQALEFGDATFDTAVTACTFCSVPDPVRGLRELLRCLKPGGRLLMFEHVRSRIGPIAMMQDLLTPLSRRFGPDMNRDTVANVLRAGFELVREENAYLDIVKAIRARRPAENDAGAPARSSS
jgi:ubiquinone/menaquinone biosynthesis C-methylase UbiE